MRKRRKLAVLPLLSLNIFLTACGAKTQVNLGIDEPVKPVDNMYTKEEKAYTDSGGAAAVVKTYTTPDGLCFVKVTEEYFDVTLQAESATPFEVGKAYGTAIKAVYPEYESTLESFLFDNIGNAFPNLEDNYSPVEGRMNALFGTLDDRYKEEIEGLSEGLGAKGYGIAKDGILSKAEIKLAQMAPDCLKQTACSGLSLWGKKTSTGDMMAVRCLEGILGSDRSICNIHTVLHINNGEKSFTNIGFLGMFNVVSGVNDTGLFAAILDIDAKTEYKYEGKQCYSYAVRHILEEYDNATDAGNYMVSNSDKFTFSHNIMLTDGKNSYCAEDACSQIKEEGKGYSILRDSTTPIMKDLKWESPDSLCIINSYVTEGNYDLVSANIANTVKFAKYNKWVKETDKFDVATLKDMMTQEITQNDRFGSSVVENVHNKNITQMIILDYHQRNIQVAFTGIGGVVDKPSFYEIASF